MSVIVLRLAAALYAGGAAAYLAAFAAPPQDAAKAR
jgi:hypothetical protein